MSEQDIQTSIRLRLSNGPTRLFRNNVGVATSAGGSVIRYGLSNGSGDLIGFTSVEVTPDMVGQTVAVFVSVEVKSRRGVVSEEQQNWISMVKRMGGRAGVAYDLSEAGAIVNGKE